MRILLLTDNLIAGGISRYALNLILGLRDLGADISLGSFSYEVAVHSHWLEGQAAQLQIPIRVFPGRHVYSAKAIRELIQWLNEKHISILHTNAHRSNVMGRLAAKIGGSSIKLVDTIHGLPAPRDWRTHLYYNVLDWITRMQWGDLSIAVCEDTRRKLIGKGMSRERIITVHNGIETSWLCKIPTEVSRFQARGSLGLASERPTIGFISRVTREKGAVIFIEAMLSVAESRSDVQFVIVGDGPAMEQCRTLVSSSEHGNRFGFFGEQSNVLPFYAAIDILVLPSISEGIPYTVLEAMASGLPVVAASVGGLPEIIESGRTGILYPANNTLGIVEAINDLLAYPELRQSLARAAQFEITKHFTAEQMAAKTLRIYGKLLGERSTRI